MPDFWPLERLRPHHQVGLLVAGNGLPRVAVSSMVVGGAHAAKPRRVLIRKPQVLADLAATLRPVESIGLRDFARGGGGVIILNFFVFPGRSVLPGMAIRHCFCIVVVVIVETIFEVIVTNRAGGFYF